MKLEGQTPPEVAELISDILVDKLVCDIGCGEGNFMKAMSVYAKKVIGIEEDKELAEIASEKGFDVYGDNSFFFPLPEADVYYSWSKDSMGVYLKAKYEGTKGIFIFGRTLRPSTVNFLTFLKPEIREVNGFTIYITKL